MAINIMLSTTIKPDSDTAKVTYESYASERGGGVVFLPYISMREIRGQI